MDLNTAWSTRMDHYMKFGNEKIHYTALFLSFSIIIALIFTLNYFLNNKVSKDLMSIYKNQMANQ